jgi:hypothetical protein
MCDYSLHHIMSRPATVNDKIVTSVFPGTITRGFMLAGDCSAAVCLKPGTEIAFAGPVHYYADLTHHVMRKTENVARFRQINTDNPYAHHDALEFPDGQIVLVTKLCEGQHATVLQLPAEPLPEKAKPDGKVVGAGIEGAKPEKVRT